MSMITPDFVWARDYEEVATVESEDLGSLFRDMNAVEGDELCCQLRVRSMSVGDVAVNAAGTAFYCASVGWKTITLVVDS